VLIATFWRRRTSSASDWDSSSFNWEWRLFFFFSFLFFLLLCWVGVHCGIYKSSYSISNISYLNSSPPSFSFIPYLIISRSFKGYHFSIYIHVYTLFAPYSPSTPFPHLLSPPTSTNPPTRQDLFFPLVLWFCKRKKWISVCLR
jgi:hypothetical protein